MRLIDEFTISTAPDRAYQMLLDLERVAPCVPGGEIDAPDAAGAYPGRVSVKLGPMKFVYTGRVRITERNADARSAVVEGEGRASGGADTAKVHTLMQVFPEGSGSRVVMTTDLEIKGRAAQMGQGIIADVSRRLIRDAAACIEIRLAAPDDANPDDLPTAGAVGGLGLMAAVMTSKMGDSVRRLGGRRPGGDDPAKMGGERAAKGADDGTR